MAETLDLIVRAQNQASAALNGLRSTLQGFNDQANKAGMALSVGVSAPAALFAKQGLQTLAEFSQTMAQIEAISGANEQQLQTLTDTAVRLGAETSFSANEAADAMLNLLKAGMDTEQALAAVPGVLSLAAAGGVELGYAADVTAAALNTFQLKASEAEYVSNLLAAAANNSSANISDLAMGMQQGGFAFANANQNVDDLATSLAILTNVGLTGSDAGTALKNAFVRMISPTKEARGVMSDLNISFFDAQGNMKAFPDIIENLNAGLAGLTEEQRLAALETIFLSDGMKAMLPILNVGKDGYLEMKAAVNEVGAAQKVADARMRGLAGAFEYASGSIESAMLNVWRPFEDTIAGLIRRGADLITWLSQLPRPIINAAMAFTAVLAAAGPLLLLLPQIIGFIGAMATPIGWVVLALGALAAAWASNFGGIRDIAADVAQVLGDLWTAAQWIWQGKGEQVDWWWDIVAVFGVTGEEADKLGRLLYNLGVRLSEAIQAARQGDFEPLLQLIRDVGERIKQEIPKWRESFLSWATGLWGKLQGKLTAYWNSLSGWISGQVDVLYPLLYKWALEFANWVGDAWAELSPQLAEFWGKIQNWVLMKGIELKGKVKEWASSFLDFPQGLRDAIAILQSEWDEITPIIENHVQRFKDAFGSLQESFGPLQEAFQRLFDALKPGFTVLAITVAVAFALIGAIISGALTLLESILGEMGNLFTTLVNGIATQVEAFNEIISGMVGLVTSLVNGDWAGAWESAKQIFNGFVMSISGFLLVLWGVATSMFNIIKNTVIGILDDMGLEGKQIVLDMRTAIRMSFMQMKLDMQTKVTEIKTGLIADFLIIKSRISEIIAQAVSAVIDKFNSLKTDAATAINNLRTTVEEKFNGIKTWIEGLTFTNPFSQIMSWASEAKAAVESAVGSILGNGGSSTTPPGRASGTTFWGGGAVRLNERGTELIALPGRNRQTWLPRGAQIFPAEQVPLMMGGGGVTVNVYATVTNEADEERLAWRVAQVIKRNS